MSSWPMHRMFWAGGLRPIYGRAGERMVINDFLAQVQRAGAVMGLYGQPGAGTTTLLELAQDQGRSAGLRVLVASGAAFGTTRLSGLAQVVEQLAADEPGSEPAGVRTRLDLWTSIDRPTPAATEALVAGTAAMLRAAAVRAPLLLTLDDGVDPDPAGRAVWSQVLDRVQGQAGLGFLGVVRPQHRGLLPAGAGQLEVLPLAEDAARQLLTQHSPGLPLSFVERILPVAAGNPLALEELSQQWDRRGPVADPGLPLELPLGERLRSSYQRRFSLLSNETRDLLLLRAVERHAPLPFEPTVALQPALDAQLIGRRPDRQVYFTHPMIGAALVDLATEQQRNRAHEIWADALAPEDPERSTYHRAAATLDPDEGLARALDAQAARAWLRGHERVAVETARTAARLSRGAVDRRRRLIDAAYAGVVSGRIGTAEKLLAEARKATTTATGSLTEVTVAAFLLLNGDGDVDSAARMLTTAIDAHADRDDDPDLAVRALFAVCALANRVDLWDGFTRFTQRLRSGSRSLARATAELGSGRIPADTAALDRALAGVSARTSPAELVWVATNAFLVQRSDELTPVLRAVLPAVHGGGDGTRTQLEFHLAHANLRAGRWDEALDVARSGRQALSPPREGLTSWALIGIEALIAAHRGDGETARAQAQEILTWAVPRKIGAARDLAGQVRGAVAMAQGEYEEAFRHLTQISPIGSPVRNLGASVQITLDLVQAAVRTDRRQLARAHVRALQEAQVPSLSPYLAMLVNAAAAMVADGPRASDLYEQALQPAVIERWPFEVARIRLAYGEHLRRLGAVSRSRDQLISARDIFAGLGAGPWTRRAIVELQASGDGRGGVHRLSPQERQIALLAASGLTNKQIGERLFLSPRTVGNHLHRVFPKLGVTSRAGLRGALSLLSVPSSGPPFG
jgi:DNA-binding CsgD family transcriptional regulator